MKTLTIRLSSVEWEMIRELSSKDKNWKKVDNYIKSIVKEDYSRLK